MKNYKDIKLKDGYVPSQAEEYMNPKHLMYFKRELLQWLDNLYQQTNETIEHLHDNDREPDANDRASNELERNLELRTRDRYRKLIGKIEAAISRIEDGSYGYCEETGEEIGIGRLLARPIATLSIQAQERHEKGEHSYADDE